jgi:hypothetical protein
VNRIHRGIGAAPLTLGEVFIRFVAVVAIVLGIILIVTATV